MVRDPRIWISGFVIVAALLTAVFANQLAPHPPNEMAVGVTLQGPSSDNLLGTDHFGRDILSRVIHGARLSMIVSIGSVAIAATVGSAMGLIAGYYRGITETFIMRAVDVALAIPPIIFALFIVVFVGPALRNVIIVIGILFIPNFARVVHGVSLAAKELDYVTAARAVGAHDVRILVTGILPNVMAPILVQISLAMGSAIIVESSLSFLGLGPPPPATAWGRMISDAAPFMRLSAWTLLWPAVVISVTVVAFNIFGDAIRDALDPRLR